MRVPRNVVGQLAPGEVVTLIACCDASEVLAVAAVYARVAAEGGHKCHLVAAKTKLVTKSTVPRAELRAAVLGASLAHVVKQAFDHHVGAACL